MRVGFLVLLAACGSSGPGHDLVVSTSFVVTTLSGAGPSPLDPLDGQVISISVVYDAPTIGHDMANACSSTTYGLAEPPRSAAGASASLVTTAVLDMLPQWDARLELCTTTNSSSVGLMSDNEAGLAIIVGCRDLPASAMHVDAAGTPAWSSFEVSSSCDVTLYDQGHDRLFGGTGTSMALQAP